MTDNVVLVSGVQPSEPIIRIEISANPYIAMIVSWTLLSLIPQTTLCGQNYYYLCLTDEEAEVQPKSHTLHSKRQSFESEQPGFQIPTLHHTPYYKYKQMHEVPQEHKKRGPLSSGFEGG